MKKIIKRLMISRFASSAPQGPKRIAFTFDDGPSENTERLLDGLIERNAKASFFLIGQNAENDPELVRRIYDEGHLIGNHTYSHVDLRKCSKTEAADEIEHANDVIEGITGEKPAFMRPPFGSYTRLMLRRIDEIPVLWSMCPKDWKHENDEEHIFNYIVKHARDGQIVLLHDNRPATVPAALRAMDVLAAQGFKFVRADF